MRSPHDDLELSRALDTLPRSIEPPEDLWPLVRARLARRRRPRWRDPRLRVAAGLLLATGLGATWLLERAEGTRWRVAPLAGAAFAPRPFAPGESLITGAASRALFEVGVIGHVEVDTATRVRLLEARATAHRLALAQGTIRARINAPPRLFVVETPAGTVVDLGCAYTLTVDPGGTSRIEVTLGWVAFEDRDREALVPAGFGLVGRPGGRLGTPFASDATEDLRAALAGFDAGHAAALEDVLRLARARDAVTLWHLLGRTEGSARERVYERLAALAPPPERVGREAALRLERGALRLWWESLPGTLPILPGWQRWVWRTWLRLFG